MLLRFAAEYTRRIVAYVIGEILFVGAALEREENMEKRIEVKVVVDVTQEYARDVVVLGFCLF